MRSRDKQEIAERDSRKVRTGAKRDTDALALGQSGHLTREAVVFLQRAIGNAAVTRLISDRRHQQDVRCDQDTSPAEDSRDAPDGTVQRAIKISGVTHKIEKGKEFVWPRTLTDWNAHKPEFFTLSQSGKKANFGQDKKPLWEVMLKTYQQDLHNCLVEMLTDPNTTWEVPTKEALREKVKVYQNYKLQMQQPSAAVASSPGEVSGPGAPPASSEAAALRDKLLADKRAFPGNKIIELAFEHDTTGPRSGFLFELQLGWEAINNERESKVQFGPLGKDLIEGYLGGAAALSEHEPEKRQGPVGADVVIWRPISGETKEEGKGKKKEVGDSVPLKYSAEFMQAKSCLFKHLRDHITAAKNQLEGTGASGKVSEASQRELSLRGAGYSGTIALEIWDGVTDSDKLAKEAYLALESKYVQKVLVWDRANRSFYQFPPESAGTSSSGPSTAGGRSGRG